MIVRVNCRSPFPSAPSTSASGARRGASPRSPSPLLSRPTSRYPRSRSVSRARARFCTVTIGTNSSAPEADFARTPVASGLCRAVVTKADTANPAAVRKIAPTLCGSVIWSRTSTIPVGSTSSSSGEGRESASTSSPLWTASAPRRRAIASGRTSSGPTVSASPSSAKRRAAFSVASRRRMRRAGFASAALTVCHP